MCKRIIKLWSLALTVMLLGSMMVFAVPAVPAKADIGQQQFVAQTLPTQDKLTLVNGSDVDDIAISSDGKVIYVVNHLARRDADPGPRDAGVSTVYKSTDGGNTFIETSAVCDNLTDNVTNWPVAPTGLTKVAVAPDNADAVAVTDNNTIWISNNGGSTWAPLTKIPATAVGCNVTSIAVAPARSGTLLGREYVAAIANPAAGYANADVIIIGNIATWASAGRLSAITGTRDFMAVKFAPNFVGDRSVVAVGVGDPTTGTGNVTCFVINTATETVTIATPLLTVAAGNTGGLGDANGFRSADIALPTDFDATTTTGRRCYVAVASTSVAPTDQGVWRIDDTTARQISETTNVGMSSLAFAGTIDGGTLFQGRQSAVEVKYTTNPTTSLPTWTLCKKILPATFQTAAMQAGADTTLVRVAPDFARSNKVYAGTLGHNSGFSISTNGGITFDQKAIIDLGMVSLFGVTGVGFVNHWTSTADGKTGFLATKNTTNTTFSLWKTSVPTTAESWKRIFVVETTVAGASMSYQLSPDWATTSTMYAFETSAANGRIFRSTDAGDIWNPRNSPTAAYVIGAYWVADANTVYVIEGASGVLYKSTAGAWTWDNPVNTGIINCVVGGFRVPKPDAVLASGDGGFAYSEDGGKTFTITTLNSGERYRNAVGPDFAKDKIVWLSNRIGPAPSRVYRYQMGVDTAPVDLMAPSTSNASATIGATGMWMRTGTLYVAYNNPATNTTMIDRTLRPYDPAGNQEWDTLNTGIRASAIPSTGTWSMSAQAPNNSVYIKDPQGPALGTPATNCAAAGNLWAYYDGYAATKPKIKSPPDKYAITIDPVTGRASVLDMVLEAIGTATGLATHYEIQIAEKAVGWDGAMSSSSWFPAGIRVLNPAVPQIRIGSGQQWVYEMQANKDYLIRTRAVNQASDDVVRSIWSDGRELNVQAGTLVEAPYIGPQLLGPAGGAVGVSTTPGFSWSPQYGATKYKFVLATDGALTKKVAEATVSIPSYQAEKALEFATTYFWSVQAVEPVVGPVAVGTFTTMAKPVPPAPPPPAPVITIPAITPIITIPPAPPPQYITPAYIWAIIAIGAILVIAVIVLIARTRRPM